MPSPPTNQRLDMIDALRGFAALWVFLYHIWNVLHPWGNSQVAPVVWDSSKPWHYWVSFFLFQYGYFGVTIFFVVSGFCIHLPQARRHATTGSDGMKLEPFFQRRFWRLYPAYFAGLFVASLSLGVLRFMEYRARGWPLPLPDGFYEQAFGVYDIAYNALFLLPFFTSAADLNSVLWTLVFEVQFYLLYPLLLWFIRRIGLLPVGLILLICEALMAPTPKNEANLFDHSPWEYFFLGKYFEWYLGVVAAELLVNHRTLLPRLGLISVFILGVLFSIGCVFVPLLWPYRDIAVATTTCLLLLWLLPGSANHTAPPGRLLRLFIWLGLFSYSLYLLHIPLLRMINAGNTLLAEWLGHPSWERWMILDSIPLVILAAWGFYWLFERPFLKTK
ncbi:MAG TPA: acyltransferase [Gemmatales bacterium]|nr:acyltransferase [Gemmatales bacterium]